MTESAARIIVTEARANLSLSLSLSFRHLWIETRKHHPFITKTARRHALQRERPFGEGNPATPRILIETMMALPVNKNVPNLSMLQTQYGVADSILTSLSKSESEANAAVSFFAKMTAITNGLVIAFGAVMLIFGFRQWQASENALWFLLAILGLILALYFLFVFYSQRAVLQMMQSYVAIKYGRKNEPTK